ncbi:MAG: DUF1576 domain-containing protein [Oscillospiraceae bacterium]
MTRYRTATYVPNNQLVTVRLCLGTALSLVLMGFLCNTPREVAQGLLSYVRCSDVLITDYFVVGNTGAAFVNSGLVMLMSIVLAIKVKTSFTGSTVAMLFLMAGFALFGKNPVTILPFFLGVWIYCRIHAQPMSRYINAALCSTTLTPVVTELMRAPGLPKPLNLLCAAGAGILMGYLIIPLADHAFSAHMGYTLFNYGFAGGMMALLIASVVKAMGFEVATRNIWKVGFDGRVLAFLLCYVAALLLFGLWLSGWHCTAAIRILRHSGRAPTDFIFTDGIGAAMVNMSMMGLMSIGYILLIKGDFNGPVVGAILTSIGFGAAGAHPRNAAPAMAGVYLASLVMVHVPGDPGMQLAALFSTALAPIAGEFGWYFGVISGFFHTAVVLSVVTPCGGYNLYNNGFSAGLVAMIMVGLIHGLSTKKHRKNH